MADIKHVLSFDCADKTLGICLIGYLTKDVINERLECLKDETEEEKPIYIKQIINDIITVKNMWLFDLLKEEKVRDTDDFVRLGRLKHALNCVKEEIKVPIDNIVIEYQMGQNDLSRLISSAIVYEFCNPDSNINVVIGNNKTNNNKTNTINTINNHIVIIGPAFKNSFYFHENLSYANIAHNGGKKYKTNKTVNKHHTSENFKYFLELQSKNNNKHKFDQKIKHGDINHIADAFMQAVYCIINNKLN